MLEVQDVRKSFDGREGQGPFPREVLRGVSLSVRRGEVAAIIGPSGAGKTTLLRCVNFLERASSGRLTFGGQSFDLTRISKRDIAAIRLRTGFVFQDYNLFRNRTALGNVTEGLIAARGIPKEEAEEMGRRMLDKVGLSNKYDAWPSQLSGGQQQRVAIARALASKPEIIYFDEPTSALDPELTGEVLSVMRKLAEEGHTMLIVTHELAFARTVASQAVFMEDGAVVEAGPAEDVFSHPSRERTREFLNLTK
ncbi:MAG: amino acid ABC transporter ATP-binding protein [Fretibacterium sp.]|nr:amino acid ABC transporter ATP-binding protein [Fretibacterium sp.]